MFCHIFNTICLSVSRGKRGDLFQWKGTSIRTDSETWISLLCSIAVLLFKLCYISKNLLGPLELSHSHPRHSQAPQCSEGLFQWKRQQSTQREKQPLHRELCRMCHWLLLVTRQNRSTKGRWVCRNRFKLNLGFIKMMYASRCRVKCLR